MSEIIVAPDGSVRFIHDDVVMAALRSTGAQRVTVTRASHVEPTEDGLGWTADMSPVGGPVLLDETGQPFTTRAAALAAERVWLEEHGIPVCAPCADGR